MATQRKRPRTTTHSSESFAERGLCESASPFVSQPLETTAMPDGSMSLRTEDASSRQADRPLPASPREDAHDLAFQAFDRVSQHSAFIRTAAGQLYEWAMKKGSPDDREDMLFTAILEWAKGIHEVLETDLNVYQLLHPEQRQEPARKAPQITESVPPTVCSPAAFVRRLIDAVVPTIQLTEAGGVDYRATDDRKTFEALRPFLQGYTVADVGLLLPMIYAAGGLVRDPPENDVKTSAMGAVHMMLEDFLAEARATSPECVEVRARIVGMCMDDDSREHPSECAMNGIRKRIKWDISDLRSNCFYGDTFGGTHSEERYPSWLQKSTERLDLYKAGGC